MFAPVALRVRSYGLPLSELANRYLDTMLGDPHLQRLGRGVLPRDDRDSLRGSRCRRLSRASGCPSRAPSASARGSTQRSAEAAEQLHGESGEASHDVAIAFVSAAYGPAIERLPQMLRPHLGDCLLLGCNAGGLIGGGSEEEEEPGVALLCGRLPDAVLTGIHLEQATLPPLSASRENWWRLLDLGPESEASFLLLADPATLDAEACARGLDRAFPGSTVIGGLTSGVLEPGASRLFTDGQSHRSGGIASCADRQRRHRFRARPGLPAGRRSPLRHRLRGKPHQRTRRPPAQGTPVGALRRRSTRRTARVSAMRSASASRCRARGRRSAPATS